MPTLDGHDILDGNYSDLDEYSEKELYESIYELHEENLLIKQLFSPLGDFTEQKEFQNLLEFAGQLPDDLFMFLVSIYTKQPRKKRQSLNIQTRSPLAINIIEKIIKPFHKAQLKNDLTVGERATEIVEHKAAQLKKTREELKEYGLETAE